MERLTRQEWIKYTALAISYTAVFIVGWVLSLEVVFSTEAISWYLPAGIRICAFLFAPLRSWPFLLVVERVTLAVMFEMGWLVGSEESFGSTPTWYLIHFIFSPILYLGILWLYRKVCHPPYLTNLLSTLLLIPVFLLTSLSNGVMYLGYAGLQDPMFLQTFGDHLMLFILGDFVGIACVLPAAALLTRAIVIRRWDTMRPDLLVLLLWVMFFLAVFTINDFSLEMQYFTRIFAILPAVFVSYRFGWRAAAITLTIICACEFVSAVQSSGPTKEQMVYVILMTVTCLFLGAAMSELKAAARELRMTNQSLHRSNQKLNEVVETNRAMSTQAINLLEDERKRLSHELHDDFGQRITDIKLTASYARSLHFQLAEPMEKIMDKADKLYASLKFSIGELHPQGLNHLGLVDYLRTGELAMLMRQQGVQLRVRSLSEFPPLTDSQNIGLYRICQESINNTLKHANATAVDISFVRRGDLLHMRIRDDGDGFDTDNADNGLGLKFMLERTTALGGDANVQSGPEGTEISLSIPLDGGI